jgi:hypothetical protein
MHTARSWLPTHMLSVITLGDPAMGACIPTRLLIASVLLTPLRPHHTASAWSHPAGTLFGKNAMLAVPEPRHSFLRNLMQPAFTPEAVGRYLPRVEVVVGRWLSSWADAGGSVPGHQQFSAMTFDFILQVGGGCGEGETSSDRSMWSTAGSFGAGGPAAGNSMWYQTLTVCCCCSV